MFCFSLSGWETYTWYVRECDSNIFVKYTQSFWNQYNLSTRSPFYRQKFKNRRQHQYTHLLSYLQHHNPGPRRGWREPSFYPMRHLYGLQDKSSLSLVSLPENGFGD